MFVTDQSITFANAITDDGIDYGTGYYLTQEYYNGKIEFFGPFDHEEDARDLANHYWLKLWIISQKTQTFSKHLALGL